MTESDTTQVFRVNSPTRLLTPVIGVSVVTVGVIFLASKPDERWIALVIGGVLLVSIAIAAWLVTRTHLDVSAREITYHAIGYRVRSSWGNLAGWGKRVQGAQDLDCLILREPGMELSGWLAIGYQLLPFMNVAALLTGRTVHDSQLDLYANVIPVGMFDRDWRGGEIGAAIQRYAPQAYENAI